MGRWQWLRPPRSACTPSCWSSAQVWIHWGSRQAGNRSPSLPGHVGADHWAWAQKQLRPFLLRAGLTGRAPEQSAKGAFASARRGLSRAPPTTVRRKEGGRPESPTLGTLSRVTSIQREGATALPTNQPPCFILSGWNKGLSVWGKNLLLETREMGYRDPVYQELGAGGVRGGGRFVNVFTSIIFNEGKSKCPSLVGEQH